MTEFPAQLEQVTVEWLDEVLRRAGALAPGRTVTGFRAVPIGAGVGMLGVVARLELDHGGDGGGEAGPASLIVKFATPVESNRAIAMATRMYEREVTFFREVAHTVDLAVPRAYAAEIDPATGDCVVLLEDLRDYRVGDQVEGCDAETAKLVIDAFVPLHLAYWGRTDQELLRRAVRIDGEQLTGFTPAAEATWQRCVELFPDAIDDALEASLAGYIAALPELHRMMGRTTQTVIHGDARLDNVLFGDRPGQHPCVLLDWQALMVSNPLQDVAYLLSQNVRTEDRRAAEDDLLRHYHGRLVEGGVTDYPFERCVEDYDVAALYLLSYGLVIGGGLDVANERGRQFADVLLRRSCATVLDRGLVELIPN